MNNTFLFETLLFFERRPCYYRLYISGKVIKGEPTPHHYYTKTSFPHFIAKKQGAEWVVEGIHDQHMIRQIISELEKAQVQ
jgi:hypothetical protein